jgi:hypothetical protein
MIDERMKHWWIGNWQGKTEAFGENPAFSEFMS